MKTTLRRVPPRYRLHSAVFDFISEIFLRVRHSVGSATNCGFWTAWPKSSEKNVCPMKVNVIRVEIRQKLYILSIGTTFRRNKIRLRNFWFEIYYSELLYHTHTHTQSDAGLRQGTHVHVTREPARATMISGRRNHWRSRSNGAVWGNRENHRRHCGVRMLSPKRQQPSSSSL